MPEHDAPPSELLDLNWAYSGNYARTKPDEAKRKTGWQPKDESPPGVNNPGTKGEIIPADVFNWLQYALGVSKDWLLSKAVRQFGEVHTALKEGILYPSTFLLYDPVPLRPGYLGDAQSFGSNTWEIKHILTDGVHVYAVMKDAYSPYAYKIVAALARDNTNNLAWEHALTGAFVCWACDGRYLYVHEDGVLGVKIFDLADGTLLLTETGGGTLNSVRNLAANGAFMAAEDGANPGQVNVYGVSVPSPGDPPVLGHQGMVDLGDAIDAWCYHGEFLYVALHELPAPNELRLLGVFASAGTPAERWRIEPQDGAFGLGTLAVHAMRCDGERIYLATDHVQSGSLRAYPMSNVNATKVDAIWVTVMPGNVAADALAHAKDRLYVVDDGGSVHFASPHDGALITTVSNLTSFVTDVIDADEKGFYMASKTDKEKFFRVHRGTSSVMMQAAVTHDPYRLYNHRAVPVR